MKRPRYSLVARSANSHYVAAVAVDSVPIVVTIEKLRCII